MIMRPGRQDETEDTIAIWYAASAVAHPFLTAGFMEEQEQKIREVYAPMAETWVCEVAGKIVGFVSLIENEVGGLFVHPEAHGHGYGKALMDKAVELRGSVRLDVFEENEIGRAFYDRYGFRCIGRRPHEDTGRPMLTLEYTPE